MKPPTLNRMHGYLHQMFRDLRTSLRIRRETRRCPIRIIVGASGITQAGWVATDKNHLDIAKPESWRKYCKAGTVDAILAEHVLEHVTPEEAARAAYCCFDYLKPGGHLRVAVPDGLHPDPGYIAWVKPGGSGPGSDDHKVLYTYKTLCTLFRYAGFEIRLLEYFDEYGEFHGMDWDPADGMIRRSRRFDKLSFDRSEAGGCFDFTSIILDAVKPMNPKG